MTIIAPLLQQCQAPAVVAPSRSVDERYQGLARRLVSDTDAGAVIGLTSSSRGEGVSTLTEKLALGTAESLHRPVLVVDANFDDPSIEKNFGLQPQANSGLRDLLAGTATAQACFQRTAIQDLVVLGPGTVPKNVGSLHDQDAWREMLANFRQSFALVLIDMPVVETLVAQFTLADVCDGIVLVVEAERARKKAVVRAKDRLERMRARLIGVVLNKRMNHIPSWLYQHV